MRIAITGTPGTGKTSMAKALAKKMKAKQVDVKKIVEEKKIFRIKKGEKEKTVDLEKLRAALKKILSENKNIIIESHLLCEFPLLVDLVVVTRCDPKVLEKRLRKRRYPKSKIKENLLCEALDYCTIRAEQNYRAAMDVDATRYLTAEKLEKKILKREGDKVNWSAWLLKNGYSKPRK